jgi:hypothetical protein
VIDNVADTFAGELAIIEIAVVNRTVHSGALTARGLLVNNGNSESPSTSLEAMGCKVVRTVAKEFQQFFIRLSPQEANPRLSSISSSNCAAKHL